MTKTKREVKPMKAWAIIVDGKIYLDSGTFGTTQGQYNIYDRRMDALQVGEEVLRVLITPIKLKKK